jgi:hypothetical protein
MEYFEQLKNMIKIRELSQRRLSQLKTEQRIDEELQNCSPKLAFIYLTELRKLNRKLALETYNSSLLEYPQKVEKNLNIFEDIYSIDLKSCEKVQEIIEYIKYKY